MRTYETLRTKPEDVGMRGGCEKVLSVHMENDKQQWR
jgi:hypothetical protein